MTSGRRVLIKKTIPLLVIGLLAFILYLYFFVGINEMARVLQTTDLYYFLAFSAAFLGMVVYSMAWQSLLNLLSIKIAFRKTFLFMWIGTFVDIIIPLESVSGEISRAYLVYKTTNENTGRVVASIVTHRILAMGVTVAGLIISLILLFLEAQSRLIDLFLVIFVALAIIGMIFLISLLIYLSSREKTTQKLLDWVFRFLGFISRGRWKLSQWRSAIQDSLRAYHEGIDMLRKHPKGIIVPVFFSVLAWLSDLLLTFLVFYTLPDARPYISMGSIVVIYSITVAIPIIPLSISAVGLTDTIMAILYNSFGIPGGISGSVTILTRLITFWFKIFVGYFAVHFVGVDILSRRLTESMLPKFPEEKRNSANVG